MRLASASFNAVSRALTDAFSAKGDYKLLAVCIDKCLQDIVGPNNRIPDIVIALIECAENNDCVDRLVTCAKEQNPSNVLLGALDVASLEEAPAAGTVVERGEGTGAFKARLLEAFSQLGTPGMETLAAHELTSLLAGSLGAEVDTLFMAVLGTLRTRTSEEILAELVPVVSAALRRRVKTGKRPDGMEVDFARARLPRLDASDLDLHEADLAFADLRHADLTNTNLWRARGYGVDVTKAGLSRSNLGEDRWHDCVARNARFHDCRMVSAFFKDADLAGAEFQGSRLQGAHFERADLTGSSFVHANIADAFFKDATIDRTAAGSIARAVNWQSAHLDPPARQLVGELAAP